MKAKFYKLIFLTLLSLHVNSCTNKCIVGNIEVSDLLGTVAKDKSIDYCELLKDALTGNQNAVKKLSLLEFENAVGYDHGAVIVDLIISLGEAEYIKAISTTNKEQKKLISSYIDVGMEYGSNALVKEKDFKKSFPDLYIFLR